MSDTGELKDLKFRSVCPIARCLDLLGDKWTLLILRDALFFDVTTFAEFAARPEKIPTNLLASRLKRLVEAGLLTRVPYQTRPPRYEYLPTDPSRALIPLLRAAKAYGETYLQGKASR
ncbi:MAG: helix-turn-helix transcriptional regulator [Pseudomonadales bacterium]|jgi:DNA-binding HxlR family transcriptional regulator|nr:helix-turn-helix transcriptional regulator [Pseudomonadales bacterium]MDP4640856.1 helix-turn-helix transcriptional regulator [Pseudomonadales bacterium]MDP4765586.1 helix-turn-helix transcriptional regulator [Pseudomonadales bacterium]MDP4875718.1 helix-turn-helix transcriptional regulator [Pseudomonadales bacterium]MDP4911410.1 helix-turn-helix transcriptional regulator [Pseudomonadales bacterium]